MLEWKAVRFTKIEGESGGSARFDALNINMNVLAVSREEGELQVKFVHKADYTKDVGFLTLYGYVTVGGTEKELDALVAAWKKRALPEDFASKLGSVIFYNCEVNGVLLSRVLAIPAPVLPPTITPTAKTAAR